METNPTIPPVIAEWQREALTPVAAAERIETLDVLRGFALFGILTVNMMLFSWPVYYSMAGELAWDTRMDAAADWVVRFLAEGKFYTLFSFLFGLGVAIQMERAESRDAGFAGLFCRRLLVLLGIGLVHAFAIWEGDILVWYALFGFLLLAFRKCKPRTLLIWAAIFLLLPVLAYGFFWALIAVASQVQEIAKVIEQEFAKAEASYEQMGEENLRAFSQGTIGEIFAQRAWNVLFGWQYAWFYVPTFFAMFLIGLYAGKRRIARDLEANVRLIRRTLVWGLCLGLPANAVYAIGYGLGNAAELSFTWVITLAAIAVGGPALSLAYAAAITLLLRRDAWKVCLRPIAAVGRMGLSNYLFQSLVCTTIFYSYGLGLYGSVERAAGLGLAMAIYAVLVPFSVCWLRNFQFGPVEWLWRSLTYGKLQPMRI